MTRCRCGLPTLCGACLSYVMTFAPLVALVVVLIWSSKR